MGIAKAESVKAKKRVTTEGEANGPKFFTGYFKNEERLLARQQALLNKIKATLSFRQKQCEGKFSEVRAHGIEQSNLRQELESVNYATVVPKNSCLPDTQEVVSHREDLTTVPEPVIYCECRAAIETVPPDVFDGQSVGPRI